MIKKYRFKYVGPSEEMIRRDCDDETIAVASACDGATLDIECDESTYATIADTISAPAYFVPMGEMPENVFSGIGPHSANTLVPMFSDCRGFALVEVAISDDTTREIYAWIELRVIRATAADPEIVASLQRFVASGWSGVVCGLGAEGVNLTIEVELPPNMPSVKIETKVHATRLT